MLVALYPSRADVEAANLYPLDVYRLMEAERVI